jgi:hypothetical protein
LIFPIAFALAFVEHESVAASLWIVLGGLALMEDVTINWIWIVAVRLIRVKKNKIKNKNKNSNQPRLRIIVYDYS